MVQKRAKKAPVRRKKGNKPSFTAWLTRLSIGSAVTLVLFIGILFAYSYGYPELIESGQKQQPAGTAVTQRSQASSTSSQTVSTPKKKETSSVPTRKAVPQPDQLEIPHLKNKQKEQVIRHEGYTVSYNSDFRLPNWVAYELTAKEAKSDKAQRSNKFVPDPDVQGASAGNEDYTRTGYDRGHMAPAGDMKWSLKAMRESFYLSNICPQAPGLNRGKWNDLEGQCRLWAKENGALWIVTGPLIEEDLPRMGKNNVAIPKTFYKVICTIINNEYKGIGFLFENRDYDEEPLSSLAVSIDRVEKVTGIDFFPSLPDEQEKRMEREVDLSVWSF
ncbi:MAG: DNA/RNA non-specific endonuclease [Parabacteroides sp.]